MKHRTLLPPTVHPSMRTFSRVAILISKSLSYAKWADVNERRREKAGRRRSRCWVSFSEPPFSEGKGSIFLSLCRSLRYPHILIFFLWVLSFSTSSYFHIPTQRTSPVCPFETSAGILDTEGKRRDTGRAARLYASATLNHSLEITYVWIDSYYYKAYVGRACAVGGPTIDSPDWPSDLNFFLASFDFCYLYRRRLSPLLNGRGASLLADRY